MEKQALNTESRANGQKPKIGDIKQIFAPFVGLSTVEIIKVVYFIISFSLSVGLDAPTIYLVLIIANFANAARVVKHIKFNE